MFESPYLIVAHRLGLLCSELKKPALCGLFHFPYRTIIVGSVASGNASAHSGTSSITDLNTPAAS